MPSSLYSSSASQNASWSPAAIGTTGSSSSAGAPVPSAASPSSPSAPAATTASPSAAGMASVASVAGVVERAAAEGARAFWEAKGTAASSSSVSSMILTGAFGLGHCSTARRRLSRRRVAVLATPLLLAPSLARAAIACFRIFSPCSLAATVTPDPSLRTHARSEVSVPARANANSCVPSFVWSAPQRTAPLPPSSDGGFHSLRQALRPPSSSRRRMRLLPPRPPPCAKRSSTSNSASCNRPRLRRESASEKGSTLLAAFVIACSFFRSFFLSTEGPPPSLGDSASLPSSFSKASALTARRFALNTCRRSASASSPMRFMCVRTPTVQSAASHNDARRRQRSAAESAESSTSPISSDAFKTSSSAASALKCSW
mmetsp:Transcript_41155/g.101575  ORF Transcript_41155/g.101575 Transcript_41155/m.101575 type:complete len:373 (+) Transcript_41155:1196-2314(+)